MGEKTLVMGSMGEKRAVIDLSTNNRTECVLDTVGNSRLEGGGGWGNIGARWRSDGEQYRLEQWNLSREWKYSVDAIKT